MTILNAMRFRLSYGECDPAGIVYFGAYLPWMERTHTGWHLDLGMRTDHLLERFGCVPISRHLEVDYERPALLFDPVVCEMRLDALGRTSYRMRFDLRHEDDGGTFAVGRLTLVFVDADRRPAPVPPELRRHLPETAHSS